MPAALSLIQLPSLDGLVHLCSDILLAVHGVVQHILRSCSSSRASSERAASSTPALGVPVPSTKYKLRVGETHLAHLLQQRQYRVTG